MATTYRDSPLTTEQILNLLCDSVQGLQVQIAQHDDGFYYNETIAAGKTYTDPECHIDVATDLGREASEVVIESTLSDLRIKFDDPTRSDFKFIEKDRAYALNIHKVSDIYIDNTLSGAVTTSVRIDVA